MAAVLALATAILLRLPDGVDRKDVRIVQFDLWDLADADHIVQSIEQVSIRATTISSIDIGFVTWYPPYPCFVRDVVSGPRRCRAPGERRAAAAR